MKYEIFINSLFRLPMSKATKLYEEYNDKVGFKNFAEQQKATDVLARKYNYIAMTKKECFGEVSFLLSNLVFIRDKNHRNGILKMFKEYPFYLFIELIGEMNFESIMILLNKNWRNLPSLIIETCIINLPDKLQLKAINMFYEGLEPESPLFDSFYYSVCEKARLRLKQLFPNYIDDPILLELEDLNEAEFVEALTTKKEKIMKISADDLIELLLLKATKISTLNTFMKLYNNKVRECSNDRFKLLFTRSRYIKKGYLDGEYYYDEDELSNNKSIFELYRDKFYDIGIKDTLSLFNYSDYNYNFNEFSVYVILKFLDIAYDDIKDSKFINNKTRLEVMRIFEERCRSKDYSLSDFERLVRNIKSNGKNKFIHDDYIEAIIACGKLLKDNIINDKHPLFIELRDKFTNNLISNCIKDGTYTDNFSFNGIFYRLAKGSISFCEVYDIKTYKGLIYLSKSGDISENADFITNYLTDEQLAKINISPVLKWKKTIHRVNNNADNLSFIERMGLQLLCYFGRDRARYLLESPMQGNRMENLFDGLNYSDISINDDGTPNTNEELLGYLFSKTITKEPNSIINKMIRNEIPDFEKFFREFCISYDQVKNECKGLLSIKRIISFFENVKLPIELKPDEILFKPALVEMNTFDKDILSEAIGLCKDARERTYSTIPKVEGKLGDFTYRVLDLDDPMAIAEGYLSHCCFVVRGLSYSSLKHSMQSKNGRSFEIYYKGKYLGQSWIWRNGDVICFDSVEAGSKRHGLYKDNIRLVDVYKKVAQDMIDISSIYEDEEQRVKVVTVGKSDYEFKNLEKVEGIVPRPLEKDVFVYDSDVQYILAGDMPEKPRYGDVRVKYKDSRKNPIIINNVLKADIDTLDDVCININSLRYRIYGIIEPIDFTDYFKIISGDGWYILINNDNTIESGCLENDEDTIKEYEKYIEKYWGKIDGNMQYVKRINPPKN